MTARDPIEAAAEAVMRSQGYDEDDIDFYRDRPSSKWQAAVGIARACIPEYLRARAAVSDRIANEAKEGYDIACNVHRASLCNVLASEVEQDLAAEVEREAGR